MKWARRTAISHCEEDVLNLLMQPSKSNAGILPLSSGRVAVQAKSPSQASHLSHRYKLRSLRHPGFIHFSTLIHEPTQNTLLVLVHAVKY